MKKMSKLNRITSFFSVFVLVLGLACSFSFRTYASSRSVPYAEPSCTDNQGYLIIELADSSGHTLFNTFFWSLNSYEVESLSMLLTINERSVTFQSYFPSTLDCTALISAYWNANNLSVVKTANLDSGTLDFTYNYSSSYTIVGYNYKGNVDRLVSNLSSNTTPTLNFSTSSDAVLLQQIVEELLSLRAQNKLDNDELKDLIDSFDDSVTNKLNTLISVLRRTNVWLSDIYDLISESFESLPEDTKDKFKEQGEELNDLNEQNKLDKPTEEDIKDIIDNTVSEEEPDEPDEPDEPEEEPVEFKDIVVFFTTSDFIVQSLTIVFSMALVSYILFGKR